MASNCCFLYVKRALAKEKRNESPFIFIKVYFTFGNFIIIYNEYRVLII